ncbi:hypothetical protein I7X12_00015 [Halosimplex litoreum]|uniref:Uncharacterized protein n=1 Tax=Halosimplex litoreum TaxID=1198301 RepID=A0A7T3KVQ1_9EURY|nr:hypothetical protein [Halosimplex litoreum]QPV63060.1 hypothetical protein I7X12_00015 [Halosimplex litoreum]
MSDSGDVPKSLSYQSVAGLFLSSGLAVFGLFALPVFQSFGLEFRPAFWLVLAIEAVALVGVVVSVLTLHRDRTLD